MEAIAKGILSGLGYGLLIGPLFFLNVRLTLSQGFRHGVALVAGAFTSDCLLVLSCWWGAGQLAAISSNHAFQTWFGLICGLLLLGFGISALWPRKHDFSKEMTGDIPVSKRRYAFFQGLLINSTNPSNWLFWLSVATIASQRHPLVTPPIPAFLWPLRYLPCF
jgi:threonine/homoserine/homoserine lactone efflux protein